MARDCSTRFIGTQFYRHPNPPVEDWPRDLARIRDSGLKVVRTWLYWLRTNPKPGHWDFSDTDRLLFVSNTAEEPTCTWVALEGVKRVENLVTGQTIGVDTDGHLKLTLKARQTVALRVHACSPP